MLPATCESTLETNKLTSLVFTPRVFFRMFRIPPAGESGIYGRKRSWYQGMLSFLPQSLPPTSRPRPFFNSHRKRTSIPHTAHGNHLFLNPFLPTRFACPSFSPIDTFPRTLADHLSRPVPVGIRMDNLYGSICLPGIPCRTKLFPMTVVVFRHVVAVFAALYALLFL